MSTIWYVEDYLNNECIDERYYSVRQEALDRRNELGYGIVKSHQTINDKSHDEETAGRTIRVFYDCY